MVRRPEFQKIIDSLDEKRIQKLISEDKKKKQPVLQEVMNDIKKSDSLVQEVLEEISKSNLKDDQKIKDSFCCPGDEFNKLASILDLTFWVDIPSTLFSEIFTTYEEQKKFTDKYPYLLINNRYPRQAFITEKQFSTIIKAMYEQISQ